MNTPTLEAIVTALDNAKQRATYGAVAGFLDRPATFLMQGIPRNPLYSWVVNAETHMPTGYTVEQMADGLQSIPHVIASADELDNWLRDRRRLTALAARNR